MTLFSLNRELLRKQSRVCPMLTQIPKLRFCVSKAGLVDLQVFGDKNSN